MDNEYKEFQDAIIEMEEDTVFEAITHLIERGKKPIEIAEAARDSIMKIGQMFEQKEIFLTELIIAGELLTSIMKKIGFGTSNQEKLGAKSKGKIVVGTVEGDIHSIGKTIVIGLLASNGYEVIDLGVNIPPQKFIDAIKLHHPQLLGLSGLLTSAYQSMKNTVQKITEAGLRSTIQIIIGGGSVDQKVCDFTGADGFGSNAVDAVKLANKWIQK